MAERLPISLHSFSRYIVALFAIISDNFSRWVSVKPFENTHLNAIICLGINQYSDDPHTEFELNQYFTKSSVLDAIDDVVYKKGRTNIGLAINYTREVSLVEEAGARPDVIKVGCSCITLGTRSHLNDAAYPSSYLR